MQYSKYMWEGYGKQGIKLELKNFTDNTNFVEYWSESFKLSKIIHQISQTNQYVKHSYVLDMLMQFHYKSQTD